MFWQNDSERNAARQEYQLASVSSDSEIKTFWHDRRLEKNKNDKSQSTTGSERSSRVL